MDSNQKPNSSGSNNPKKSTNISTSSSIPTRVSTGFIPKKSTTTLNSISNQTQTATNLQIKEESSSRISQISPSSQPQVSTMKSSSMNKASNEPEGSECLNENPTEKEMIQMRNTIKDLNEKLETIKLKRSEDREKLRDYEKSKLQMQQLNEFKAKAQEIISDLNKEIHQYKQENKSIKEQFESYKEEMSNHEQRIEEMTVDKELAEAKVEELQDDINRLNDKNEELKLELEVLKGEIEINGVDGASSSFQFKQLEKEQERLKAALIKLRDLSLQDKTEINNMKKLNEDYSLKIKNLIKENELYKTETNSNLIQINELKDQITATLGSVQMIEQLTEQNLDLEAKIVELKETIADLEAINEVNDQLQENAREEEKELRQSLDLTEGRIREFERQIELLKYNIADHEKTILKYRDVVKQLQNENDLLNRKIQAKIEEEKINPNSTSLTATFDFKQKFIEMKNIAKIIENESNKIEILSLKRYNGYLLNFMTDQFLKRGGDHECILALLFFKRMNNKCDLILSQVKEKRIYLEESENKSSKPEQQSFYYEISILLTHLKLLFNKFDYVLNTSNTKVLNNIGSMFYDFNSHEKNMDMVIELLQKDQFDESINLEPFDKTNIYFQTLLKNHLSSEKIDETCFIEDFLKFSALSCQFISNNLDRINSINTIKDETSEITLLLKELNNINEELKPNFKKAHKFIPKDEINEKKIVLNTSIDLRAKVENSIFHFINISKTLKEINTLLSSSSDRDSNEIGLNSRKLENLAYQACDKVYSNEDNGPYDNLKNSINLIKNAVTELLKGLENGDYETELNEEEFKIRKYMINSPIHVASENFKNALLEAESIKYKLDSKEEEIKELKKHFKLKVDELSEQKLRISLIEKKSETAQKELDEKLKKLEQSNDDLKTSLIKKEREHVETLEAMQQEIDSLQNERRDLKEKLRQATKKNLFDNIISRQVSDASNDNGKMNTGSNFLNSDSVYLIQEVKLLKEEKRFLQKHNTFLRKCLVNNTLKELPNFPNQLKDSYENHLGEDQIFKNIMTHSNLIMKNILNTITGIEVYRLNSKNNKTRNSLSEKNTNTNSFLNQATLLKLIQDTKKIQTELFDIKNQLIKPDLTNELQSKRKLIAEIKMPDKTKDGKVFNLNLNIDEIKHLIRTL